MVELGENVGLTKDESCPHCHGGQTLFDCEICQNSGYIELEEESK